MAFNAYAADESVIEEAVPQYAMPQSRDYTSPSLEAGDAYNDEYGWAPGRLAASAVQTPSAQRLGSIPRYDFYTDPQKPSDRTYDKRDADDNRRHAVEDQRGVPFVEDHKGITASDRRWAPNPRSVPVPESRKTQQMAPDSYSFTRPFDQMNRNYDGVNVGSARTFNGEHFSMADHRRTYEVVGTAPVRTARNTYRIEPTPWDTDVVDLPADNMPARPSARLVAVEVPGSNRAQRLM